jgi:PAS domain S-box-containing protein
VIEGLPGLVAILGPDGSVERVNRQIEEYCGQTLEELRNWGTNGTVHPEDLPRVAEIFGNSIAAGTPYKIEQRLRRFDGEYRWFDNRGHPLRDENGVIMAWHVLLSDIDDLKRAEEAVRARERELRQQAETFPQMLWSATAEGNIDYCNERLLEYSGLAADEVMNERWVNLLHPDDREPAAKVWMHCIATGDPYSVEVRHFHVADQSYRWILTMALPLRDSEGRVVKWYGSCVEIHDRKLAEEGLRASQRHLAQLIDTIPAYVFSAAPDGAVNYLNPQMREWFGRAEERIMAAEWVHLTHPDDRDETVEAWLGAVAAGTPYRREVRFLHRSGEYRWCDNLAQPLRDEAGTIVAWHGVVNDVHDRKLAEVALKASEQNLRLIIDTIPVLAWSARADGTADFFNRHYLDYVGRSREALADWQWMKLVHPEDLNVIKGAWEIARETGATGAVEARLRRHDGTYRWFLFQTSPLRDESGKIVKWYGVHTDIEDRKRAEQDLAARERTLREAHDHLTQAQRLSQTGSFTTDVIADTHIWSDELYRILEYDRAEVPTFAAFRERIHADDLAGFDAGFKRSISERAEFDEVFRIVTPKGNTKYLHAVAHFLPSNADRPTVIGSIQDISESKRAEEELRRSAYYLAAGERVSLTGSFAWDLETDKIVISEQLRLLHELDKGVELTGPDFRNRIHPDDVPIFKAKSAQLVKDGDTIEYEMRLFTARGRLKYLRAFVQMIRQPDGRLLRVGAVQDITERRSAEEALDKVRSELAHVARAASLGELAASIAHEVNQPLAGIITNANACQRLLAKDPPDIEGAIKTAQRSLRDGNRASEVTRRLRGLFRKQDFVPEPLDLNEAAQEVIAICAHDLQRRRITLSVNLDPTLRPVIGDRIQIQQVILNLVLNAADAVQDDAAHARKIFIETSEANAGIVQLAVRDTGRGLPEGAPGRIFEAFYTTKPNGMGIGLSVSKSIIERHEGKIWAFPAEGGGATFTFSIPICPDQHTA